MGVWQRFGRSFFRAFLVCVATAGFPSELLFAASLEVTGKTFIGRSCNISNDGEARFNTSQLPGSAILVDAETSRVIFEGAGETTLYGDTGLKVVGNGETSIVFRTLPNFRGNTAILGNHSTTVRFENVQGAIHGNAAAGLFTGDDGTNVVIYGQNLLRAPVEGNVHFGELSNSGCVEEPIHEEVPVKISEGEDVPSDQQASPVPRACFHAMRNILLQTAPERGDAVLVEKFRTNRADCGGTFFAFRHALKNTPSSLALGVGRGRGFLGQNYYGICWANASEDSTWNMYGLWNENRHQTYPHNRITCVGCAQGCLPWHIQRRNYTIKPIFGLGAEQRIMRHSFFDASAGKTVKESFSRTVANFSLSLNASCNTEKSALIARIGFWHPIHMKTERLSLDKSHFYDVRCAKYLFRKLKCELASTGLSLGSRNEFFWSLALIYNS